MKNLLTILLLFFAGQLHATNYYLSDSRGSDARTPAEAQQSATPWKTIARLNEFMSSLHPGDSVLFRRGEVFAGTLRIVASGTAASAIVFASYDNGNDPVISGLASLSNWYNAGSNVWETILSSAPSMVNVVLVNGVPQRIGRYPNATAANGGYLTISNASGSSSITDNSLPASPDWTGADVVIRKARWVLDRNTISQHSGHTINYISESGYGASAQYGYFIENDPKTLDLAGEWYYRAGEKKLGIYLPGGSAPATIEASVVDTLVSVSGQQGITFNHLVFRGANKYAFQLSYASSIRLSDCTIQCSGSDAVSGDHINGLVIERCLIDQSNNNACLLQSCTGLVLRGNTIRNTGIRAGMGKGDSGSYEAILLSGDNNLVEENTIDSTGYIPITFNGSNITIRHNYIRNFAFVKDDGGGIYTWNHSSNPPVNLNRLIEANVVVSGIGAPEGTDNPQSRQVHGIYIDDNADAVTISRNTVASCASTGIFLHNAHDISVLHNTLFNNERQLVVEHDNIAADAPVRNLRIAGNVIFARTPAQGVAEYKTIANDLSLMGSFDSNYYCRPIDNALPIFIAYNNGSNHGSALALDEWQQLYQQDLHGLPSPVTIAPYRVQSLTGPNQYGNGSFNTDISGLYSWAAAGNFQSSWTNGALDGGSLKTSFSNVSGSGAQASVIIGIGQLHAAKQYLLHFSLKGSDEHKKMEVFLRKSQSPYNDLSERKLCRVKGIRTENEYLFTATANETDASLGFAIEEQSAPVYIDNIRLNEAIATVTNPDDSIRFAVNPTAQPITVALDGTYMDVFQSLHAGTIDLAPYSSAVLIRQPGAVVLPTSFFDFNGVRMQNKVALQWSVSTDQQAVSYIVERLDGSGFAAIGQLPSANTGGRGSYRFIDSLPRPGRNQYRIRQVARNGSSAVSRIVFVNMPGSTSDIEGLMISPNPATDHLNVSVAQTPEEASLVVHSVSGAVLKVVPMTSSAIVLDIASLSRGSYLLCFVSSHLSICREFIKN